MPLVRFVQMRLRKSLHVQAPAGGYFQDFFSAENSVRISLYFVFDILHAVIKPLQTTIARWWSISWPSRCLCHINRVFSLNKTHVKCFLRVATIYAERRMNFKTDSRFAPSQWETSLQSNAVSHWLGANLGSVLNLFPSSGIPALYQLRPQLIHDKRSQLPGVIMLLYWVMACMHFHTNTYHLSGWVAWISI